MIRKNKLNLGADTITIKQTLDDLIKYIYYQFPLDYERMAKIYPDSETIDTNTHHFESSMNKDDKYVYTFIRIIDNHDYRNPDMVNELHEYLLLDDHCAKKLKLKNIIKIKLINREGINHDTRGTQELDYVLHFWDTYCISKRHDLSFHDLIIGAYKIKSHKFDTWYEMYDNIELFSITQRGDKKAIYAQPGFDHGP
jgi:hypothetical protein